MNKYYGESERRLNNILKLCNELDNCIIFIDEVSVVCPDSPLLMVPYPLTQLSLLMTLLEHPLTPPRSTVS